MAFDSGNLVKLMIRALYWLFFGLAFSSAISLRWFDVPVQWVCLATGCVLLSTLFANLSRIRWLGLVGFPKLFHVLQQCFAMDSPASTLLLNTITFLLIAIGLAMIADYSLLDKEKIL
jgi:hypothetical protein